MNQLPNQLMWVADLLLPCSIAVFLLPFDPRVSTIPVAVWLIVQLITADRSPKLLQWSWLALLLFSVREWWFNHPPHPASIIDGLLLISAIVCASTISPERWNRLLLLPALGFLPLLLLSHQSLDPNLFVGPNQAAYLFGFFLNYIDLVVFEASKILVHLGCKPISIIAFHLSLADRLPRRSGLFSGFLPGCFCS